MKTIFYIILSIFLFFLSVTGCSENAEPENKDLSNQLPADTTPEYGGVQNTPYSPEVQIDNTPKVPIPEDEILLQVMNINIDEDNFDEQILILKKRDSQDSVIKIAVVDFDIVRNRYTTPWFGETGAVNISSFSLSLIDIIGDHKLEIVCTGIDTNGWQTLDLFRRTRSAGKPGLYYTSIFNIAVNGDITIEEIDRDRGYQSGQKTGQSFPITTLMSDIESENIFDLIKTSYYWKHQDNKYIEIQKVKIPGEEIENNQLAELFKQNDQALIDFLSGPWSKISTAGNADYNTDPLIFFEPAIEKITFYSGDIQETFTWQYSSRNRPRSLSIKGQNTLVNYMTVNIYIYIESLENINIVVFDSNAQRGIPKRNNNWSGNYYKLTKNLQDLLSPENLRNGDNNPEKPDLSGFYLSDTGIELFFDSSEFTMKEENNELKGGFSIYTAEDFILVLKAIDPTGIASVTRTYKIDYLEKVRETQIIRTLYLVPGTVGIYGFKPSSIEYLRFEQIETIEADETETE